MTERKLAALVVVTYGTVAYGYLLGTRLPVDRPELATGLGVLGVALALDVLPALWGGGGWRYLLWPVLSVEGFNSPPSIAAMSFRSRSASPVFALTMTYA